MLYESIAIYTISRTQDRNRMCRSSLVYYIINYYISYHQPKYNYSKNLFFDQ